jgi:predicted MarR family transcription regulator
MANSQHPIVSSSHLVSPKSAEMSELEYGLIVSWNAFSRWAVRCMAAAGLSDLTITDVLVLHHINHRARNKKLADICFVLNYEDVHVINYSLKKLAAAGLAEGEKVGKEVFYRPTPKGEEAVRRYREVREQCLIKNVVAMQQSYAGTSGLLEATRITELVDDALRIQEELLRRHGIEVVRWYGEVPAVALDKTRVMQILVNLIDNACQAMEHVPQSRKLEISVSVEASDLCTRVRDNGHGIVPENLSRMFSHGFTTKHEGHGFGLHSCALAATEMGGTLTAHSDGPSTGATLELRLPLRSSSIQPLDAASSESQA